MLVLEATSNKQGERPGDYHWCVDGELAYRQGTDCSRLDCGCERGWAGFDSHSATTTVEVVDRPDLSIGDLGALLARSLCAGGWIATPDPKDELVMAYVDEIAEMASHFGEGSVLERDGEWTRLRDGSAEPINPFDRVGLEDMTAEVFDFEPMDLLGYATSMIRQAGPLTSELISTLAEAAWPEAQTLGCALEWLTAGELTHPWHDTPDWLDNLGDMNVAAARRRKVDDGAAILLSLQVGGEHIGLASTFVALDGRIDSFFGVPDDLSTFVQLTKTLQRQHYKPFQNVALTTAFNTLSIGRRMSDMNKPPIAPGAWPQNRTLLDFIIDYARWDS